ncbi:WD40/YVTN/BNR-like repeat-containing protein, partial [Candidatus Zixiibacteriota bacterium]
MRQRTFSLSALLPFAALLLFLPATLVSAQIDPEVVAGLFSWREVGPANPGGRITDVEGVESRPSTIYIGAATGGVWKTVNAGITWEPIFDDQPNASIGDIGLSRSNPDILYVGTGEANNRNSSPWGAGIFKSVDGGENWDYVGLKETQHIARIVVHPTDPDVAYVAAMGRLWGTSEERGVYKTTNGGRRWERIFYLDERTGATDLAMDPVDTDILYVAAHDRLRDRFDAGDPVERWGPLAGIYMTRDGGENWTRCTEGLPTVDMGRIGIATARSRPGRIYALIGVKPPPRDPNAPRQQMGGQEEETLDLNRDGIWRSDDYGATWEKVNNWNNRPSYYSQIRVDPNDADVIWGLASPMAYSDDGGRTVISGRPVQGSTHIDYHSCWIDPNNSDHVIVGGDGGINVTWDRGKQWEVVKQIGLGQFYAIAADMRKPYYLAGGLQDNGVWVGASRGRITRAVTNSDWFPLSNADGFFCQIDPTDFNTVYAETQGGSIYRQDLRTGQSRSIRPRPPAPTEGGERERYRFDWNTPFMISPHNPRTLYLGGNKLFKTVNRGDNWQAISPDLTAQVDMSNSAIVTVAESPIVPGLLWVGTNDGNVQITRNDGATWALLNDNIPGAPSQYWVKRIEASHHEPGRAFLVYDGHRHDDRAPYVYMTDDYGQTWKNITSNLPEGSCYVIREDLRNPDLLFVGSEFAVHYSLDRGATWTRFMNELPTVPVHDLLIHPRDGDLIAGTHGRGAWIVNNITPLQQLTAEVMEADVHLLDIRPEVQWLTTYEFSWTTDKRFYKPNPPTGSTIAYYLKDDV